MAESLSYDSGLNVAKNKMTMKICIADFHWKYAWGKCRDCSIYFESSRITSFYSSAQQHLVTITAVLMAWLNMEISRNKKSLGFILGWCLATFLTVAT
ncbi:hypothetical protein ACET7P_10475 [Aeromonas veronii]|uniref:hypothetical protein n=1 Tax=Aeromonas sp. 602396 TaxID=2712042 RepID=UPI0038D98A52